MRILLLQAYLGRREPPVAPLGLATLAAHLGQHEVRIFDPNIAENPLRRSQEAVEDFKPDLLGFSLRNLDTTKYSDQFLYFQHFQSFVQRLKAISKSTRIAVGGSGFSLFPREIMRRLPEIDIGFFLEADRSFPQFICSGLEGSHIAGLLLRHQGEIIFTGFPEVLPLSEVPAPRWELLDMLAYKPYESKAAIGVEAKRGCAMKCCYCTYPQLGGEVVRLKSPVRVVDEIELLKNSYGIERIFFCDPVFNYPLEHAEAICKEILRRDLKIRWGGYHQDRFITAEYVELARNSGCDDFYFSPDAATDLGLKILDKSSSVESLNRCLHIIAENGQAHASFNFFASLPETGWANFLSAWSFIFKAKRKLRQRLTRYKLSYLRLEPNTPLARAVFGNTADSSFLLPKNSRELSRLYYRKSRSLSLNLILSCHYHWGRILGSRNTTKEDNSP